MWNKALMIICVGCSFSLLTSCAKKELRTEKTTNKAFKVDYLFEHDGVKVYRFYDNGHARYFTNKGHIISDSHTRSHTNTRIPVHGVKH